MHDLGTFKVTAKKDGHCLSNSYEKDGEWHTQIVFIKALDSTVKPENNENSE